MPVPVRAWRRGAREITFLRRRGSPSTESIGPAVFVRAVDVVTTYNQSYLAAQQWASAHREQYLHQLVSYASSGGRSLGLEPPASRVYATVERASEPDVAEDLEERYVKEMSQFR